MVPSYEAVAAGSHCRGTTGRTTMNKRTLLVATTMAFAIPGASVFAQDLSVGVSWSNFQEERWKTDEAAIKSALEAAGATAEIA